MTDSNENALLDKILNKVKDLSTLEILTAVAPIQKNASGGYDPAIAPDTPTILTKIELVEGDIVTVFHEDSLGDNFQELRNLHKEREAQGMKIIEDRINAIKELIELIGKLREARKKKEREEDE